MASGKQLLMASILDEALFTRPDGAKIPPVDPDNAGGEEGPLADLVSLLGKDGLGADNISVREHPSRSLGMHAS